MSIRWAYSALSVTATIPRGPPIARNATFFCLPGRQAGTEVLTRTSVPAVKSKCVVCEDGHCVISSFRLSVQQR